MPTISEVAKRAGVSSSTVSHVINKTRFVSSELQGRVQAAMDELGYQPNALAQSLRRGEAKTLGLILPDSSNPYFAEIGHSVEAAAFEKGYNLILCNTEGDLAREHLYVAVLGNKKVDGIIFASAGDSSASIQFLLKRGFPVVVIDRDLASPDVDEVVADNQMGGYLATQHLIRLGHQLIGCIAGPSYVLPSGRRVSGYRRALEEAGIPEESRLIQPGDFHPETGYSSALALLRGSPRPTAIFACNDLMAMGVIRAAVESGLSVPEDLAVVGYDDIVLASYVSPPLTTVAQPKLQMGQAAVRILVERIHDGQHSCYQELLPVHLVVRKSSGVSIYR